MSNVRPAGIISHLVPLTDEEAVTLRRVSYGQSEVRALPREALARLLSLRLVKDGRNGLELTMSGREHFDALPRVDFSAKPGRRRDS